MAYDRTKREMGNLMRIAIASVLAASLVSSPLAAQPLSARAEMIFANIGKDGPGCAAGAIQGGKTVFANAYGLADLEHKVPLTIQSPVYLASVSKQFTAFAILELEKDGKLKRSDSVRKYISELGTYADAITIEHLLTHTSGLRDYDALADLAGRPYGFVRTETDFLDVMGRQQAGDFLPGANYAYSNAGYTMLSLIIQRVAGKNLDATARARIFAPLGMARTRFQHDHRGLVPDKAQGYSRKDGAWRTSNVLFDTVGSGGMYSTVEDMLLWAKNFTKPKIGADVVATLAVSAVLTDGKKTGYGMGIAPGQYRGLNIVQHNGGVEGYRTTGLYFPQADFAVVVLCNSGEAGPERMARQLADIWLKGEFKDGGKAAQRLRSEVTLDAKVLNPYVGDYLLNENVAVSITLEKDQLLAHMMGGHKLWLQASSERNFFTGLPLGFAFDRPGKDGRSARMVMDENGTPRIMTRISLPPLTAQELADFVGHYASAEQGVEVTIAAQGGNLVLKGQALLRMTADTFSADHPYGAVKFRRQAGKVTGFTANGVIQNLRFDKQL